MSDDVRDSTSPELPDDEDLRRVYRELPADEPRAEIDQAILDAARRSVAQGGGTRGVVRRLRWALPLAMAAGVVLTLTLHRAAEDRSTTMPAAPVDKAAPGGVERAAGQQKGDGGELTGRMNAQPEEMRETKESDEARSRVAARKDEDAPASDSAAALADRQGAYGMAEEPEAIAPAGAPAALPAPPASPASPASPRKVPAAPAASPSKAPAAKAATAAAVTPNTATATDSRAPATGNPSRDSLLSKRSTDRLMEAPAAQDAARSEETAMAPAPVPPANRAKPAAENALWPFGLEAGLAADEACRRLAEALRARCVFAGDDADLTTAHALIVDRGTYSGRSMKRIVLHARDGVLDRVEMWLTGPWGEDEQVRIVAELSR